MDEHDDNSESPSIHYQVSSRGNPAQFLFQQRRFDERIHLDLKYIIVTTNEMKRANSVQQYVDMRSFSKTNSGFTVVTFDMRPNAFSFRSTQQLHRELVCRVKLSTCYETSDCFITTKLLF
jgi:hypothetical protein